MLCSPLGKIGRVISAFSTGTTIVVLSSITTVTLPVASSGRVTLIVVFSPTLISFVSTLIVGSTLVIVKLPLKVAPV